MNMKSRVLLYVASLALFSGCASYQAVSLNSLNQEYLNEMTEEPGLLVGAKAFNKLDCKNYLDRDVISEGYQPVQIMIRNNSNKTWLFSLNNVNIPIAHAQDVAQKVHTSTIGRAAGYGVGALFLWPLIIPAIVDGVKSSEANRMLDQDFAQKTARDQVIYPHSGMNSILFIPVADYRDSFNITLLDQNTQEEKEIVLNPLH